MIHHDHKHFHFWCQKVLPLVFDESLSYYELLCKVVHYLNHLLDDTSEISKEIYNIQGELDRLNNYISSDEFLSVVEKRVVEVVNELIDNGVLENELDKKFVKVNSNPFSTEVKAEKFLNFNLPEKHMSQGFCVDSNYLYIAHRLEGDDKPVYIKCIDYDGNMVYDNVINDKSGAPITGHANNLNVYGNELYLCLAGGSTKVVKISLDGKYIGTLNGNYGLSFFAPFTFKDKPHAIAGASGSFGVHYYEYYDGRWNVVMDARYNDTPMLKQGSYASGHYLYLPFSFRSTTYYGYNIVNVYDMYCNLVNTITIKSDELFEIEDIGRNSGSENMYVSDLWGQVYKFDTDGLFTSGAGDANTMSLDGNYTGKSILLCGTNGNLNTVERNCITGWKCPTIFKRYNYMNIHGQIFLFKGNAPIIKNPNSNTITAQWSGLIWSPKKNVMCLVNPTVTYSYNESENKYSMGLCRVYIRELKGTPVEVNKDGFEATVDTLNEYFNDVSITNVSIWASDMASPNAYAMELT